jgi:hypothetical protein
LLKEDWDERLRIEKVATLENNPVNASATCPKPSTQQPEALITSTGMAT